MAENRQVQVVIVLILLAIAAWGIFLLRGLGEESYSIEESEDDCALSLRVYLNAQHLYFRKDWDNDGCSEFAADLDRLHTPGLQDESAWTRPLVNKPLAEADDDNDVAAGGGLLSAIPRKGYLYRDLLGEAKEDGTKDFTRDGGDGNGYADGFGLLGYPAEYGKTGKRKFVIGLDGVVYARDEGNSMPFDYYPDVGTGGWEAVTE